MIMNETGTAPPRPSECAIVVLLVDDQAMVGEAIRRTLLNEPDVQFRYCANPMEAVAVAKEVKPTVILQDLVMPNVSGLERWMDWLDRRAPKFNVTLPFTFH